MLSQSGSAGLPTLLHGCRLRVALLARPAVLWDAVLRAHVHHQCRAEGASARKREVDPMHSALAPPESTAAELVRNAEINAFSTSFRPSLLDEPFRVGECESSRIGIAAGLGKAEPCCG